MKSRGGDDLDTDSSPSDDGNESPGSPGQQQLPPSSTGEDALILAETADEDAMPQPAFRGKMSPYRATIQLALQRADKATLARAARRVAKRAGADSKKQKNKGVVSVTA